MKTLLATLAVTLGVLSAALPALANPTSDFRQLPEWAQNALDQSRASE